MALWVGSTMQASAGVDATRWFAGRAQWPGFGAAARGCSSGCAKICSAGECEPVSMDTIMNCCLFMLGGTQVDVQEQVGTNVTNIVAFILAPRRRGWWQIWPVAEEAQTGPRQRPGGGFGSRWRMEAPRVRGLCQVVWRLGGCAAEGGWGVLGRPSLPRGGLKTKCFEKTRWCRVRVPAPPSPCSGSLGGAAAPSGSPVSGPCALVVRRCGGGGSGGRLGPSKARSRYAGARARSGTKGGLWRPNGEQEAN